MTEIFRIGKKLVIRAAEDVVFIEIFCRDSYEAVVLCEDLIARGKSKEGFALRVFGSE